MNEVVDPWQEEARSKGLPDEFVERLESSDAVTEAEKRKIVDSVSSAEDLEYKRKVAIEYGRRLGEDEANRRRETGSDRAGRIARAMRYAAWEFDGKPLGYGKRYDEEFGTQSPDLLPSGQRPAPVFADKNRKK